MCVMKSMVGVNLEFLNLIQPMNLNWPHQKGSRICIEFEFCFLWGVANSNSTIELECKTNSQSIQN